MQQGADRSRLVEPKVAQFVVALDLVGHHDRTLSCLQMSHMPVSPTAFPARRGLLDYGRHTSTDDFEPWPLDRGEPPPRDMAFEN